MPELQGRDDRAYRRMTARAKRTMPPICSGDQGCGQEIDLTLDWRDPMSWTYDHDVPLSLGGDLLGPGVPKHRACNARRGNGTRNGEQQTGSRDW